MAVIIREVVELRFRVCHWKMTQYENIGAQMHMSCRVLVRSFNPFRLMVSETLSFS